MELADDGADMGVFQALHGAASAEAFAKELKAAAMKLYGTPIREYLPAVRCG